MSNAYALYKSFTVPYFTFPLHLLIALFFSHDVISE